MSNSLTNLTVSSGSRGFLSYTIGDALGARNPMTGVLLNKKFQIPKLLLYAFGLIATSQWKWLRSPDDGINLLHKSVNFFKNGFDSDEFRDRTYYRHAAQDSEFGRLGGYRNEARNLFAGLFVLGGGYTTYREYGKWLEEPAQITKEWRHPWRMPATAPYPARLPWLRGVAWTGILTGIMGISYFMSSMAGNADARELKPGTTSWHPANFRPSEDFCTNVFVSEIGLRCFTAPLWNRVGGMTMRGSNYLYLGIGRHFERSRRFWAPLGRLLFQTSGIASPEEVRTKVRRFSKVELSAIADARKGIVKGNLLCRGLIAGIAVYLLYEGYQALQRFRQERSGNPFADGFFVTTGSVAAVASLGVALRIGPMVRGLNAFSMILRNMFTPARLGYLLAMTAVGGTLSGLVGVTTRMAQGFDNAKNYLAKSFGLGYLRPWPNRIAINTWSALTDLPMSQSHGFFWGQASVYQPAEAVMQRRQAVRQKYLELAQKYRLAETRVEQNFYARLLAEREQELVAMIRKFQEQKIRGTLSPDNAITLKSLESSYDDPDDPDAEDIQRIKQTLHIEERKRS